jgi:predicted RNA binding protein YcfA (HicA-like mRNA interferase family)
VSCLLLDFSAAGAWRRLHDASPAVLGEPALLRARVDPVSAGADTTDGAGPYSPRMAKAARVLAALRRDGWVETRRSGSHRVLVKGDQRRIRAYHDGIDLGAPALARIARDYGYTVDELRKL